MAILQKIVPNLWFDGNAKEAVEFYTSVFKDGKVLETTYYPMEGLLEFQKPLAGKELTISYELAGQKFLALNAGPEFKFNESVSFIITCEDQAEIDYYWEKLSAVPESEQCGWCKDKYGLSWQIVPAGMDQIMQSENGSASPKAFAALLEMKKIVIAELEAAAKS